MVTHTRQILDTAAADQDDAVLLQVVAFSGDVGRDLDPVGQTDTGNLTKSRVRLFRGGRFDRRADAALLRRVLVDGGTLLGVPAFEQSRGFRLLRQLLTAFAH